VGFESIFMDFRGFNGVATVKFLNFGVGRQQGSNLIDKELIDRSID
jgi:hypothetical protein